MSLLAHYDITRRRINLVANGAKRTLSRVYEYTAAGPNGQPAAGIAAGGHFDPAHTGKHLGRHGNGHKGDLTVLTVDASGNATTAAVAPHLTAADVKGHSIMIHANGDNYSDQPAPLGGGGARIACGVVK